MKKYKKFETCKYIDHDECLRVLHVAMEWIIGEEKTEEIIEIQHKVLYEMREINRIDIEGEGQDPG